MLIFIIIWVLIAVVVNIFIIGIGVVVIIFVFIYWNFLIIFFFCFFFWLLIKFFVFFFKSWDCSKILLVIKFFFLSCKIAVKCLIKVIIFGFGWYIFFVFSCIELG